MKDRTLVIVSLVSTSLLVGTTATALAETPRPTENHQPASVARDHEMPAIDGGLEIAVAISGAQTVGDIGGGMDASDVIGSAGQFDLEIGSRLTPHLTLAFYSNVQPFARVSTDTRVLYTGSAGAVAALHLRPTSAVDPWISLGSGVRGLLIENDDGYSITVGAELARVQLGTDFRLNEDFALGPVIGASASLYGAAKPPMQDFAELSDKGINWTFTAGVAGRFNAFGTRR